LRLRRRSRAVRSIHELEFSTRRVSRGDPPAAPDDDGAGRPAIRSMPRVLYRVASRWIAGGRPPRHGFGREEPMMRTQQFSDAQQVQQQLRQFQACIDACLACAQMCRTCATACLREPNVDELRQCISLNEECATVCLAAASLMSRGSDYARALCQLCADVCDACGAECADHLMQHCQTCAQTCKACADECRRMADGQPRRAQGIVEA
jgi:hypothetical protein